MELVHLLKQIVPHVKRIAVIVDQPTCVDVSQKMRTEPHQPHDPEFTGYDVVKTIREFKHRMSKSQTKANAVALLATSTSKDGAGQDASYKQVLECAVKNGKLPDFSFWKDHVSCGTLCAVTVSGYQQGLGAGKIARGILVKGKSPSVYPMKPTLRGKPVINLARANRLGIQIRPAVLLSAEIVITFKWENE